MKSNHNPRHWCSLTVVLLVLIGATIGGAPVLAASGPAIVDYVQAAPTCYALTLTHTGTGSNPVASPAKSPGCADGWYAAGAVVGLTASPDSGWTVGSWTGTDNDASTANTNQVTMPAAARTATVNYVQGAPTCYALTLTHTGAGSNPVASPARSPSCTNGLYVAGAVVDLTASPGPGWTVGSWTGTDNEASTANTNQVTMPAAARTATVNYVAAPPACYTLTTAVDPAGGGTVNASPTNSTGCNAGQYVAGAVVQLTANANAGFDFANWTGDLTGSANPGSVTMNAAKTVTAHFTEVLHRMYLPIIVTPPEEVRVSASSDDAEESAAGDVTLKSTDLELVYDLSNQTVGMRFAGVRIPKAATIVNAYVQFQADEVVTTTTTALTIQGQAIDNAPTFAHISQNISSRTRTAAAVSWSPVGWPTKGAAGPDQRTPSLAPIIQEIVNRTGWSAGNSLVIIITGTGERVAVAYDGLPAAAPLLHVEYRR